jgi:putative tricarboxylic transport membrane protein
MRAVRNILAMLLVLCGSTSLEAAKEVDHLTLVVPSAVGGGWDLTAKAMKQALEEQGIVRRVEIVRYPGAGGLVGLSQFVARHRGQDDVLMVGGLVMMGSALRDEAAITLRDVTPIARLTAEWSAIVVPARSPIQSVGDLREAMLRTNPVRWAGGAFAGPDQGLVWKIATATGAPIDEIPYYGMPGGRRVAESLIEDRADLGVSGYAEFAPYLTRGDLRLLGVAAPRRIPGVPAPTLREQGLDVTMMNWRAVFAPPGIDAAAIDRLTGIMEALERSPGWRAQLARNKWTDSYLTGDPFNAFIEREQLRWADLVNPQPRTTRLSGSPAGHGIAQSIALGLAAVALGLVGWLSYRLRQRRRLAAELELRCRALSGELQQSTVDIGRLVKDGIDGDFIDWNLSSAESDIAWFMLRGLPMKEIANLRGTSERTVRQQAQAIYRKAGLEGRSDLAGRVLERFI